MDKKRTRQANALTRRLETKQGEAVEKALGLHKHEKQPLKVKTKSPFKKL